MQIEKSNPISEVDWQSQLFLLAKIEIDIRSGEGQKNEIRIKVKLGQTRSPLVVVYLARAISLLTRVQRLRVAGKQGERERERERERDGEIERKRDQLIKTLGLSFSR